MFAVDTTEYIEYTGMLGFWLITTFNRYFNNFHSSTQIQILYSRFFSAESKSRIAGKFTFKYNYNFSL